MKNIKKFNECIEQLYKKSYKRFYRKAYLILQNEADSKEVVNDAFVKSYRYIDKFSKKTCPEIGSYIVNIVKSISINIKNRQKKIIFSEYSEKLMNNVTFLDEFDDILEKMIKHESFSSLLDGLSVDEQEIIELKVIDGLTLKEVGEIMGISEEASKKRYQRIKKKIREKKERRIK